jgi:hypothetical protein
MQIIAASPKDHLAKQGLERVGLLKKEDKEVDGRTRSSMLGTVTHVVSKPSSPPCDQVGQSKTIPGKSTIRLLHYLRLDPTSAIDGDWFAFYSSI